MYKRRPYHVRDKVGVYTSMNTTQKEFNIYRLILISYKSLLLGLNQSEKRQTATGIKTKFTPPTNFGFRFGI